MGEKIKEIIENTIRSDDATIAILETICSEIEEAMPERKESLCSLHQSEKVDCTICTASFAFPYNKALDAYKSALLKRFGGGK